MPEAFICDYIRTPIGRFGGSLSSVRTDDLAAKPLEALQQRNPTVDWEAIDDVVFGCANQAGEDNRNVGRMAVLLSGLPTSVPSSTINRLCGSGMNAVIHAAQANGRLAEEIAPVTIPQRRGDDIVVEQDEHPRSTTLEKLGSLPTPFRENGTVTAGNASGVNDGAAALIVASQEAAQKHGLKPIARVAGGAYAGVEPRIMGIGPAPATQKLCQRLGLTPQDFSVVELNEAFASQGIAVLRELGLDESADFINPNGGAIALGHPLGMSGARITGTAALELQQRGGQWALATMCIGVGQGIAIALERV